MKKTIFLLLFIITLVGCSKELDRDLAQELLTTEVGFPAIEFKDISFDKTIDAKYGNNKVKSFSNNSFHNVSNLIQKGLLTSKYNERYVTWVGRTSHIKEYVYDLTPKAKQALYPSSKLDIGKSSIRGSFPVHLVSLNQIAGIKFDNADKSSATIEYSINYTNDTPFKILARNNNDVSNLIAKAELYDDGWRITSTGIPSNNKLINKEKYINWNSLFEATNFNSGSNNFNISSIITNETTKYDCFIRKVYTKENYQLIEVDFVQLKATTEDGYEFYKVVNTNPKLRTFLISENSQLQPNLKFSELSNYETSKDEGQLFIIETNNGEVSRLIRNDAG